MPQRETSKRRKQEDSATNAASFRLRDVTISMERTSQPDGVKFTIEPLEGANLGSRPSAVAGLITTEGSGTILYLDWSAGVTVWEMAKNTVGNGHAIIAIARSTSKSAGAR